MALELFWDIKIRQAFAEFEEHTRTQFTIFRGTQKEKKEKKYAVANAISLKSILHFERVIMRSYGRSW